MFQDIRFLISSSVLLFEKKNLNVAIIARTHQRVSGFDFARWNHLMRHFYDVPM